MSKRRRVSESPRSPPSPSSKYVVSKDSVWGTYDNTNVLMSLPPELFAALIFNDHFSLEELAKFDKVIVNRSLRAYFHQVYLCLVVSRPTIVKHDATLRWMRARGIRGKNFELWHGITKTTLLQFFKCGSQFESLNLTGYDCVNDAALSKLATSAPMLKSINLAYCADITDAGILALAKNCTHLEEVILWACYEVTDDCIRSLGVHCPRIRKLNLRCCRRITDEGLQLIGQLFPRMESLNFTYCNKITDAGVQHLAVGLRSLRQFSLGYCGANITDVCVKYLARHCRELEYLDLTGCEITNAGLMHLANNESAKSLRNLHISTCRQVSDMGLQQLGKRCARLLSLHMAGCEQITPAGLRALPAGCVVHYPV
jgi:hypothetical protein